MAKENVPTITIQKVTKLKLYDLANNKRIKLSEEGIARDVSYDEIINDLLKK